MIAAEQPGLFDQAIPPAIEDTARKLAEARRDLGVLRAGAHADEIAPGWRDAALAAVRAIALERVLFQAEDARARCQSNVEVDGRAWGAIMRAAQRLGWIHPAGYAPSRSSNCSPKVQWRSLIAPPGTQP